MKLLARLVALAGLGLGAYVAVAGIGPGVLAAAVGYGVVVLALILWFVTPANEGSDFGLGRLPEDHPVREKLEQQP